MKLYVQMIKLLIDKFIFRQNTGTVIRKFSEKMGVVYIKVAQMLATQNYGNLFTEEDRKLLSSICDDCNPIQYDEIEKMLRDEFGLNLDSIFSYIEKTPIGSASVSQVHRAVLKNGEEVAIKIKRKDITKTIDDDISKIRNIVHKYGKFVHFDNYTGGDHALDLYLSWIKQETDFEHEKENIKTYQKFADTVNGQVENTKKIKVPKLYENLCTSNVIVMEFIKSKTINKSELSEEYKEKIVTAFNSYIQASFWAMFNDKQIVFHGDPHSGNVCIDENGDICFLDMGLLCVLSDEDAKLCRKFFITAYTGNYEELYKMLVYYGKMSEEKKVAFKADCKRFCEEVKQKEVTYYFIDMINVCLNYELCPPDFLFSMAKAFICLNGINNFSNNKVSAFELLHEQTTEFMIKRSLKDCYNVTINSLKIAPSLFENTLKYGLVRAIAKETAPEKPLGHDIKSSLEHLKETLEMLKVYYSQEEPQKRTKHL